MELYGLGIARDNDYFDERKADVHGDGARAASGGLIRSRALVVIEAKGAAKRIESRAKPAPFAEKKSAKSAAP